MVSVPTTISSAPSARFIRLLRTAPGAALVIALLFTLLLALAPSARAGGASPFPDLPSDHWAEDAVVRLSREGIIVGYPDGSFRGERALTRYEMALVVTRLLDLFGRSEVRAFEAGGGATERALSAELAALRADYARLLGRVAALEAVLEPPTATPVAPADAPADAPAEARLPTDAPSAAAPAVPARAPVFAFGGVDEDVFVPGEGFRDLSGEPSRRLYVGVAPGIASSSGLIAFGLHAGYDRLWGPLGVATRLFYDSAWGAVRLSADAQLRASPFAAPLELYGGLGVGLLLRQTTSRAMLELPLGLEVFLTPRYGLFVQVVSTVPLEDSGIDSYLTAGLNIRF